MTFRVRTALVVLILTALTMGGAFASVWHRVIANQRRHLDDALLVVARREAGDVAAGHTRFTDAPGPSANAVGPLPKFGALYEADGRAVSTTDRFRSAPPMPRVPLDLGFDFEHDGVPLRGVLVSVGSSDRRILLATTRSDIEDDAHILAKAMTIVFCVGCLWAAVIAFGVATMLTREHRVVASVARTVASGDTSARVEFRTSDVDLRQLAMDLNAMIERLVGLLGVHERFVSHAAHELRTPLTSLRIELEHAIETAREPREYDVALNGALESVRRLTDLAEDLLQLARVKGTKKDVVTSLEEALAEAVAEVAPVGTARNVRIVTEPVSAIVQGDRRSVARIFRNVIENAIRYSPDGGSVRVEGRLQDAHVVIGIVDQGPGIGPDDAERIFEPFTRGVRSDDTSGAGLGLSIARGLARAFGGDLTVEHGQGGRFFVELPRGSA